MAAPRSPAPPPAPAAREPDGLLPHDWHRDVIADFAAAIRAGHPPAVSGRSALELPPANRRARPLRPRGPRSRGLDQRRHPPQRPRPVARIAAPAPYCRLGELGSAAPARPGRAQSSVSSRRSSGGRRGERPAGSRSRARHAADRRRVERQPGPRRPLGHPDQRIVRKRGHAPPPPTAPWSPGNQRWRVRRLRRPGVQRVEIVPERRRKASAAARRSPPHAAPPRTIRRARCRGRPSPRLSQRASAEMPGQAQRAHGVPDPEIARSAAARPPAARAPPARPPPPAPVVTCAACAARKASAAGPSGPVAPATRAR